MNGRRPLGAGHSRGRHRVEGVLLGDEVVLCGGDAELRPQVRLSRTGSARGVGLIDQLAFGASGERIALTKYCYRCRECAR